MLCYCYAPFLSVSCLMSRKKRKPIYMECAFTYQIYFHDGIVRISF